MMECQAAVLREVGRPMAIGRIRLGPLQPGKMGVQEEVAFRWGALMQEKRITRSSYGGARPAKDFPAMAQAWLDGALDLDSLITDRLSLDQLNEGFAALKRGAAIRSVVMFA